MPDLDLQAGGGGGDGWLVSLASVVGSSLGSCTNLDWPALVVCAFYRRQSILGLGGGGGRLALALFVPYWTCRFQSTYWLGCDNAAHRLLSLMVSLEGSGNKTLSEPVTHQKKLDRLPGIEGCPDQNLISD